MNYQAAACTTGATDGCASTATAAISVALALRSGRDRQPRIALVADIAELAHLVIVVELKRRRSLGRCARRLADHVGVSHCGRAGHVRHVALFEQHRERRIGIGDRAGGDQIREAVVAEPINDLPDLSGVVGGSRNRAEHPLDLDVVSVIAHVMFLLTLPST